MTKLINYRILGMRQFMILRLIVFHVVLFAVAGVFVVQNIDFKRDPSSSSESFKDPYQFMRY